MGKGKRVTKIGASLCAVVLVTLMTFGFMTFRGSIDREDIFIDEFISHSESGVDDSMYC